LSIGAVVVRGLDLGIEFRGGAQFQVQSAQADVDRARTAVGRAGVADQIEVVKLGNDRLHVETPDLPEAGKARVQQELAKEFGVSPRDISAQIIGPSWGEDISARRCAACCSSSSASWCS
jgi:preprotein translocase subunit SecF